MQSQIILLFRSPIFVKHLYLPPVANTNYQASLAQLVEQLTRNEQVSGSSPLGGSTVSSCS